MLARLFSRRTAPADIDAFRNSAVAAWIRTFPAEERLKRYLQHLPSDLRDDVEQSARDIFAPADGYLDEVAKNGDVDLESFYPALEAHLSARFPWMTATAFDPLRSYTGWYSWHEGYLSIPAHKT